MTNAAAVPPSPLELALLCAVLAILVHQVFRKYETYSVPTHLLLLSVPPALVSFYAMAPPHLLSPLFAVFFCYGSYFSALAFSVIVYRLSPFHPLAKYPGPFWHRASKFRYASVVAAGKQSVYLKALHERYGDVVRIAPNELSFRDSSVITPIMGPSGIGKGPNFIGGLLSTENVPLVGIQDVEHHMRRRRPWARGLNPSALKEYDRLIATRALQLFSKLEEQHGEVLLGKWFDYFFYDLMIDMAFGGDSNIMLEGDKTGLVKLIEDGAMFGTLFGHLPWLGVWLGYIPLVASRLNTFIQLGQDSVRQRLARGSRSRDLFYYLNDEDIPDKTPPPLRQLVDDGILVIVAGSDTTASALTSLFYCLLTHPETYATLQAEIDKFYPQGEDPFDTKHHRDMSYLHAVIQEALRLLPPVMTGSSRQVPFDSNGFAWGLTVLPPGTLVYVSPYVLHRDPRNFSFPDQFWPERWLIASGQLSLDAAPPARPVPSLRGPPHTTTDGPMKDFDFVHNEAAFLAFSHGPMNCIGKGLAMQEMRTMLCALVQRFRFRLRDGWDPKEYERDYLDYFVSTRPALPVILEPRH